LARQGLRLDRPISETASWKWNQWEMGRRAGFSILGQYSSEKSLVVRCRKFLSSVL
jgi:hypothetical protein